MVAVSPPTNYLRDRGAGGRGRMMRCPASTSYCTCIADTTSMSISIVTANSSHRFHRRYSSCCYYQYSGFVFVSIQSMIIVNTMTMAIIAISGCGCCLLRLPLQLLARVRALFHTLLPLPLQILMFLLLCCCYCFLTIPSNKYFDGCSLHAG